MPRRETDPYPGFNFKVEIDGLAAAAFSEVSGFSNETGVIEYREGTDPSTTPRKLPGLTKYASISLKRGVSSDTSLLEWRHSVIQGDIERRNASIILLDESRNEVLRWNLLEAWPSKYTGPSLRADANAIAIEELVLEAERIELA